MRDSQLQQIDVHVDGDAPDSERDLLFARRDE